MNVARLLLCILVALFVAGALPALAQLPDAGPDPLARIREAANGNVQACSATGETLCEQVAPKIIANAQGDSPLPETVRRLTEVLSSHTADLAEASAAVALAVEALRAAGLEAHTENYANSDASPHNASRQAENVVAEIRGREKPDEWVLLGAHLGRPEPGATAFDDACNAALLIEAARDIQRTGVRPRRSIRFVLFGGDYRSATGSSAYVKAHHDELDRARTIIFFDAMNNGSRNIEPGVREALKRIEISGAGNDVSDAPIELDSIEFLSERVPAIIAAKATDLNAHRTATNSLDEDVIKELKRNTAIMGVIAFDIAERAVPLGPQRSLAEIESLLKTSGLNGQMKLWELSLR
jgi:Zn-dependent M28 family amino/carboxypeptidase